MNDHRNKSNGGDQGDRAESTSDHPKTGHHEVPVVQVRGLNHWFGEGDSRKQILHNNNLEVGRGELIILTGPSGSGKTTLLTLIGGLRTAQEGSVRVLGQELRGMTAKQLVKTRREIGFIFQMHNLFDSLTALENVRMAMQLKPGSAEQIRQRGTQVLGELGLSDHLQKKPHTLSGGQRQRVAIARAVVNHPSLILADEPTAALDKGTTRDVVNLLKSRTREERSTILLVTHDNRILDFADRIVNMVDGQIVSDSRVDESVRLCEFLRRVDVFAKLGPTELSNIAEKMTREHHPARATIIQQGEIGDKFYVVEKGAVEVLVADDGQSRVVNRLKEGDFFGEVALISGQPRNATIASCDEVILYSLGKQDFQDALDASESFREQLLQVYFQRH